MKVCKCCLPNYQN